MFDILRGTRITFYLHLFNEAWAHHHCKFNGQCIGPLRNISYPSFGQICRRCEVLRSSGAVVGQVHSKDHRHDHRRDEAQQQAPCPRHPHWVAAGLGDAAGTLMQRWVPSTGSGHDSETRGLRSSGSPRNNYVFKLNCATSTKTKQEVECRFKEISTI